jgi:uncharacterized protein (DUF2267 family)
LCVSIYIPTHQYGEGVRERLDAQVLKTQIREAYQQLEKRGMAPGNIPSYLEQLAQLPMCLKAVYVDGWKPLEPSRRVKHLDEFATLVYEEDGRAAASDFQSEEEVLEAVKAVFTVLKRHVTPGKIEDIRGSLPKELKTLLD